MYELLHYKGDIRALANPGDLLGHNELEQPYKIIDAEYDPETKITTVQLELTYYGE